jgi:hypothetical protein
MVKGSRPDCTWFSDFLRDILFTGMMNFRFKTVIPLAERAPCSANLSILLCKGGGTTKKMLILNE